MLLFCSKLAAQAAAVRFDLFEHPCVVEVFLSAFGLAQPGDKGIAPVSEIVDIVQFLDLEYGYAAVFGDRVLPVGGDVIFVVSALILLIRIPGQLQFFSDVISARNATYAAMKRARSS